MNATTEKILDYLQVQAESTVDLIDTIFSSDRKTAMRKARHAMVHGPPEFKTRWVDFRRERQSFYSLLNRLKREGLVAKRKQERGSQWHITGRGIKYLAQIKRRPVSPEKLSRRTYEKKDGALIIVTFDIPERERRKRNWLRAQLVALEFRMLQQSVWLGKIQIPEDFISDLRKYEMIPYVHIFSVSKSGSIITKV